MKKAYKVIFFRKKIIRIGWLLLASAAIVFFGEYLIVDPFVFLLQKAGLGEVSHVLPENWLQSIGDSLKRLLRTAVIVGAALIPIRYLLKEKISFIGLVFDQKWALKILEGIAFGFLVQWISIALMTANGWYVFEGWSWDYERKILILPAILYSIVFCLETSVIEEFLFRGLLFNLFRWRYSTWTGVLVSSFVFGILHFQGYSSAFPVWLSILSSVFVGLLFVQAYLLYNSLWLPLGLHFGWHLAMRMLASVGLQADESIFIVAKVDGPAMLVSTKAGGAGLFELIGAVVVSIILWVIYLIKSGRIKKWISLN